MNKNKKRALAIVLAFWMLNNISYDNKVSLNYEITTREKCFARYSRGRVFIGSERFLNTLNDVNDDDILILDNRRAKDPSIKILSSYKVLDSIERNEILAILAEYERMKPSRWDRSISSMKVEWLAHNILYYFNYEQARTQDVDFNNGDEKLYQKKLLKHMVK